MSGINELKEKSKKQLKVNEKQKMGLDELFEDHLAGKPENSKDELPEVKPTNDPAIQKAIKPDAQIPTKPLKQQNAIPLNQTAIQLDSHINVNPEDRPTRQTSIFSAKQLKQQKIPTCKMTFNLREDIYKAFNDLYARRILQGRATEKSEMICEAIQLLINREERSK